MADSGIPPPSDAERLDVYLVRSGLAGSRRHARALLAAGVVRVNGRRCRKGRSLAADDAVDVTVPAPTPLLKPDPSLPLEILYIGPELLVVNKPGLLPCHPLRADDRPTLMNAVAAHYPLAARIGRNPLEGGLVHRLDNGTSGAVMVALSDPALARIRAALKNGRIVRRYLAMVKGAINRPLQLDAPIAHHPRNRRKMVAAKDPQTAAKLKARPAFTALSPIRTVDGFTLVEVTPRTGNRHQIRVHLAQAGFPIAGDELYGGPMLQGLAPGRFFLHLKELHIPRALETGIGPNSADDRHPILHLWAPLPADLAACLDAVDRRIP